MRTLRLQSATFRRVVRRNIHSSWGSKPPRGFFRPARDQYSQRRNDFKDPMRPGYSSSLRSASTLSAAASRKSHHVASGMALAANSCALLRPRILRLRLLTYSMEPEHQGARSPQTRAGSAAAGNCSCSPPCANWRDSHGGGETYLPAPAEQRPGVGRYITSGQGTHTPCQGTRASLGGS